MWQEQVPRARRGQAAEKVIQGTGVRGVLGGFISQGSSPTTQEHSV